jgi:thioredoxin 1
MVKNITEQDFNKEIKEGKVLVDCYAEWCGPCKMLSPIVDELSEELTDVKFFKLNVDDNQELAQEYQIMSIPTLLIYEDGKLVNTSVGLKSKDELKELLK